MDWQAIKALALNDTAVEAEFTPLERQLMLALFVTLSPSEFSGIADTTDRDDCQDVIDDVIGKLL